jgi:hypothetical protein
MTIPTYRGSGVGEGVGVGVDVGTDVDVLVAVGDGVMSSIEAAARTCAVDVAVGVGVGSPVRSRPAPTDPIKTAKRPRRANLRHGELPVRTGTGVRADGGTAWRPSYRARSRSRSRLECFRRFCVSTDSGGSGPPPVICFRARLRRGSGSYGPDSQADESWSVLFRFR